MQLTSTRKKSASLSTSSYLLCISHTSLVRGLADGEVMGPVSLVSPTTMVRPVSSFPSTYTQPFLL